MVSIFPLISSLPSLFFYPGFKDSSNGANNNSYPCHCQSSVSFSIPDEFISSYLGQDQILQLQKRKKNP